MGHLSGDVETRAGYRSLAFDVKVLTGETHSSVFTAQTLFTTVSLDGLNQRSGYRRSRSLKAEPWGLLASKDWELG